MNKGQAMTDDSSLHAPIDVTPPRVTPPRVIEPLHTVSQRADLGRLERRLDWARRWLAPDLAELETTLGDIATNRPDDDLARRAATHLLERPGKRIRPICVLLGSHLAGVPVDDRVRDLAVACELVHAATLLHDDVIDEGVERRGAAAARTVYGNSASILAGDYLLIHALERVASAGRPRGGAGARPELLQSLFDTIGQMVAAEALQLEQRGTFAPSRRAYLEVIEGKTASLFRWALQAPMYLIAEDPIDGTALAEAGTALGMAFQLVDDVLDLEGEPTATGKDLFADLLQGKLTWPLILASEQDGELGADVRRLSAAAARDELDPAAAAAIVARIREGGTIEATRAFADEQRTIAQRALRRLPPSDARDAVVAVVDAAVDRQR
jgi:octaprenyl-diphosphate synthase